MEVHGLPVQPKEVAQSPVQPKEVEQTPNHSQYPHINNVNSSPVLRGG